MYITSLISTRINMLFQKACVHAWDFSCTRWITCSSAHELTSLSVKRITGRITDIRQDEYHLVRWTGSLAISESLLARTRGQPCTYLLAGAFPWISLHSSCWLTREQQKQRRCGCHGLLTCSSERGTLWERYKSWSHWLFSRWQEHSDLKNYLKKKMFRWISHNSCFSETFSGFHSVVGERFSVRRRETK